MSPPRFTIPALAVIVVLAGCASGTPSASRTLRPVTLLLGFQPDVQFAPFYVAQQNGQFANAGLEVTIEHRQGSDIQRLVADGQAELGVADATDVMIARTTGIPIRYVSTLYDHFPVALIGRPEDVPDDAAGLAGLRIGTPGRFGSSWHALLAVLDSAGLTEDDVEIREYPQFDQVDGLLNGDVDLITGFRVNEPLQLATRDVPVELMTIDEIAPLPGPGLVTGDELLSADRELVAAFAAAVLDAQRAIAADVEVGMRAAIEAVPAIGEDEATARSVLEATVELWGGGPDGPTGEVDDEVWRRGYATMERLGFIDGSTPLSEMVDPVP